jgi:hypothetical protein
VLVSFYRDGSSSAQTVEVTLFHFEAEVRQRVESDLIGSTNPGVSLRGDAVIHDASLIAVTERDHHSVQIPCIFSADVFLDGRESFVF